MVKIMSDSDVCDTALIGYFSFDSFTDSFFSNVCFRNKTLKDWEKEIELPDISDNPDFEDLKRINKRYVDILKIIVNNLSYAKMAYKSCNMHYTRKLNEAREAIIEDYKISSSRIPGSETIDKLASRKCEEEFVAMEIAESFLVFWESQYNKLKLADNRITNLGYLFSQENRHSVY